MKVADIKENEHGVVQETVDAIIPNTDAKDVKSYQHSYYEKNKQQIKERRKQYYAEHKEDYSVRGKKNSANAYKHFKDLPDSDEYKQKRKKALNDNAKAYYQRNKEAILAKKKAKTTDKKQLQVVSPETEIVGKEK